MKWKIQSIESPRELPDHTERAQKILHAANTKPAGRTLFWFAERKAQKKIDIIVGKLHLEKIVQFFLRWITRHYSVFPQLFTGF